MSPSKIKISDVGSDVVEDLDFSAGRVVEMSLAFGYLVAATHNQVRYVMEWCMMYGIDLCMVWHGIVYGVVVRVCVQLCVSLP